VKVRIHVTREKSLPAAITFHRSVNADLEAFTPGEVEQMSEGQDPLVRPGGYGMGGGKGRIQDIARSNSSARYGQRGEVKVASGRPRIPRTLGEVEEMLANARKLCRSTEDAGLPVFGHRPDMEPVLCGAFVCGPEALANQT